MYYVTSSIFGLCSLSMFKVFSNASAFICISLIFIDDLILKLLYEEIIGCFHLNCCYDYYYCYLDPLVVVDVL